MEQLQQMPLWKSTVTAFCSLVWSDIEGYPYTQTYRYAEFTTVLHISDAAIRAWGPCSQQLIPEPRGFVTLGMPWVSDSISETVYYAVLKVMYDTFVTQLGDLNCIAETLQLIHGQAGVESPTCAWDILQNLSSAPQLQNYIFTRMINF